MEGGKGDSAAEAAGELLRMRQSQAAASRDGAGDQMLGRLCQRPREQHPLSGSYSMPKYVCSAI